MRLHLSGDLYPLHAVLNTLLSYLYMYASGYIGRLEEIPKSISSLCVFTSQIPTLAACQIYYYSVLQYMSVYIT